MNRVSPPSSISRFTLALWLISFVGSSLVLWAEEHTIPSNILGFMEIEAVSACIVYDEEDQWLAARLAGSLQSALKKIKLVSARGAKPRHEDLVIYLGSFETNLISKKVFHELGFKLLWEKLPPGGYLLKTHRRKGKTTLFLAGRDQEGTTYAVQEVQKFYFHQQGNRLFLNDMTFVTQPALPCRRGWLSSQNNRSAVSAAEADLAAPLHQWERELDEAGSLRLNGVYLDRNWPFTRESSDLLQQLSRMANQRGLKLIPVLSLPCDAGKTEEIEPAQPPGHPEGQSSGTGLLQAAQPDQNNSCPANPIVQARIVEKVKWFLSQEGIDSLNFSFHPRETCSCAVCQAARGKINLNCADFIKDALRWASFLGEEAQRLNPAATLSISMPGGFSGSDLYNPGQKAAEKNGQNQSPWLALPRNVLFEWNLNSMIDEQQWPSPFKAPAPQNIGSLLVRAQGDFAANQILYGTILEVVRQLGSSNLTGLSFGGLLTDETPQAIINRLTFSEYAFNPEAKVHGPFRAKLARYFGGLDAAKVLLNWLTLFDDESGWNAEKIREANLLLQRGLDLSEPEGKGNWMKLEEHLKSLK
jgi:hypothetical protein